VLLGLIISKDFSKRSPRTADHRSLQQLLEQCIAVYLASLSRLVHFVSYSRALWIDHKQFKPLRRRLVDGLDHALVSKAEANHHQAGIGPRQTLLEKLQVPFENGDAAYLLLFRAPEYHHQSSITEPVR
jgi:hypothetical protein